MQESRLLIDIQDLKVQFNTVRGAVYAVNGVNLRINKKQTIGLVGESGCGKSVTALAMLNLLPRPSAQLTGKILVNCKDGSTVDVVALHPNSEKMRNIRGSEISMIFQEPMTSLNPVFTIGWQISEAILLHQKVSRSDARMLAAKMLEKVGIPSPFKRLDEYPHQLSGGMRQRVMIAMALSCNPSLLIADEPTTALDVTIQAQILDLMCSLKEELKTAIMLITHDLGVVAGMADEVAVMYLGKIVEYGSVHNVFKKQLHPYTQGLLKSIPILGQSRTQRRLTPIKGVVPDARKVPTGCGFKDRCDYRMGKCAIDPPFVEVENGHYVRCWLHAKEEQQVGGASL